jgi:hypothetical protein
VISGWIKTQKKTASKTEAVFGTLSNGARYRFEEDCPVDTSMPFVCSEKLCT